MRDTIVIGAGGYIGSRLMRELGKRNAMARGFDLGIFGKSKLPGTVRLKDVADIPSEYFRGAVVVYLASFHREPDGCASKDEWRRAYRELMVEEPLRIAEHAHQLIYVSSMRAITDRASLYGETKARAERMMLRLIPGKMRAVRFGTVWGGFDRVFANRPNTALNYALTRSKFTGDHWTAFTTHIDDAVDWLVDAIEKAAVLDEPSSGDIMNVTDLPVPLEAEDVRQLLNGEHSFAPMQTTFEQEQMRMPKLIGPGLAEDADAAKCLQVYYGLE